MFVRRYLRAPVEPKLQDLTLRLKRLSGGLGLGFRTLRNTVEAKKLEHNHDLILSTSNKENQQKPSYIPVQQLWSRLNGLEGPLA